jgi:hypothetical protein
MRRSFFPPNETKKGGVLLSFSQMICAGHPVVSPRVLIPLLKACGTVIGAAPTRFVTSWIKGDDLSRFFRTFVLSYCNKRLNTKKRQAKQLSG